MDILSLRMFCLYGRFVPTDILSHGRYVSGCFVSGRFVCGRSVPTDVLSGHHPTICPPERRVMLISAGPDASFFFFHLCTAAMTYPYTLISQSNPPLLTSGNPSSCVATPLIMQHAPSSMSFLNSSAGAGLNDFLQGQAFSGSTIQGLPLLVLGPGGHIPGCGPGPRA
jgi:hypothetical protein